MEDQQIVEKRHRTRDLVGEPDSAVYADAKGTNELHALREGMPRRNHESPVDAKIVVWKGTDGPHAQGLWVLLRNED